MKRVVLVLVLMLMCSVAQAAPTVWMASPLDTIFQNTTPGILVSYSVDAAQGEYESVQIGLRFSTSGTTSVKVDDAAGLVLTGALEGYVYVKTGSAQNTWYLNRGRGPGWYPDPLTPYSWGTPITLSAGVNQPVWVNVYVPRGTTPGLKVVRLTAGSTPLRIDVTVHNVVLPVQPSLDSAMLLWNVRYSKAAEQLLLEHRLQAEYINPPSLTGQSVVGVGFWMGVNSNATEATRAVPTDTEAKVAAGKYPGLRPHAYVLDESPKPTAAVLAKLIATYQVLKRNGILTLETVPPGRGWEGSVGIGVTMSQQPMWSESSGVVPWFYWTLNQDRGSPKNFIDMLPINLRHLTGYVIATKGYKGALYWALDKWGPDPWHVAEGSMGATYPGEGVLIYKTSSGALVSCIRLEMMRDGAEDFDMWTLAVVAGKRDQAMAIVQPVVGVDWNTWTRSTTTMVNAHSAMLDLMSPPPPVPFWNVSMERLDTATALIQAPTAEEAIDKALENPTWVLGLPTATAVEVN